LNIETITVSDGQIRLGLKPSKGKRGSIEISWTPRPKDAAQLVASSEARIDQKLVKPIAHAWLGDLYSGRQASIEDLAAARISIRK
jgi:site-specific DNA recombinase